MPHSPAATLLLVDDAPDEIRGLTAILSGHFCLRFAHDGRQGFEWAKALQPALILLDVVMPGADGFAACRLLKADHATQGIPVIFLTAHDGPEQRVQGFGLGAADFVGKPFCPEEVLARVRVHLHLHLQHVAPDAAPRVAAQASASSVDEPHVRAAVCCICSGLGRTLTIGEIARQVGVNEKRLTALFKEHLGLTVSGFIAEQRMTCGRRLLADTNLPVQDVALEVGFSNPGNFSTAFRERTGVTPMAYRGAMHVHR